MAKEWNRIPSQWDRLSKDDKAEMMALSWAESVMRQVDSLSRQEQTAIVHAMASGMKPRKDS